MLSSHGQRSLVGEEFPGISDIVARACVVPSLLHNALLALTLYFISVLLFYCFHSTVGAVLVHTKPINQSVPALNKTLLESEPTKDKINCLQWSSPFRCHRYTIHQHYVVFSTVRCIMPHRTQRCPYICFNTAVLHPSEMVFLLIVNIRKIRSIACSGVPNSVVIVIQYIQQ